MVKRYLWRHHKRIFLMVFLQFKTLDFDRIRAPQVISRLRQGLRYVLQVEYIVLNKLSKKVWSFSLPAFHKMCLIILNKGNTFRGFKPMRGSHYKGNFYAGCIWKRKSLNHRGFYSLWEYSAIKYAISLALW